MWTTSLVAPHVSCVHTISCVIKYTFKCCKSLITLLLKVCIIGVFNIFFELLPPHHQFHNVHVSNVQKKISSDALLVLHKFCVHIYLNPSGLHVTMNWNKSLQRTPYSIKILSYTWARILIWRTYPLPFTLHSLGDLWRPLNYALAFISTCWYYDSHNITYSYTINGTLCMTSVGCISKYNIKK